ncbi:hypothetical protein [Limosilactobacillus ingluviei]|uniref:Uncharacterized protein n=1 Tax=Limosilactobacillus ingluviei DSM 15946 TaxID=1423760 RepID=A0A0R1UJG9_9LACO|nr:hypothetical protein [Limosilactobacillus ingluviei]KRL91411.1 hypothetical protein FC43_GL001145 [Limosilactobacillus ingluviei DSM 15946]
MAGQKESKTRSIRYIKDSDIDNWVKNQTSFNASIKALIKFAIDQYGYEDYFLALQKVSLKLYGTGSRGHIDEQTMNDSNETKSEQPEEVKQEDVDSVEEETTDDSRQNKEKKANNSAPKLNLSMLADADILDNK